MFKLPTPFTRPDCSRLFSVRLAGNFATGMLGVALGWRTYDLARQSMSIENAAFLVGMIGLVQFGPMFFLALPAGQYVDRHDRKKILSACMAMEVFIGLALLGSVFLPTQFELSAIFAVAALFGVVRAFQPAASSALLPATLPRAELPKGIAFMSTAWQIGTIAGPALVGFLIAWSIASVYAIATLSYGVALIASLRIEAGTPPQQTESRGLQMAIDGLRFVASNPLLLGAMLLDLVVVLLAGATALLPAFARDILHAGPTAVGFLRASPALGALGCTMILARWPLSRRMGAWMLGSVVVFGIGTVAFGLSKSLYLSCAMLALTGAADAISVFVRQTLVQMLTTDSMRGRVSAVDMLFISASNELGEFESGVAARFLGPIGAVLFGGVGSIIVGLGWGWLFPALAKVDQLHHVEPEAVTSKPTA